MHCAPCLQNLHYCRLKCLHAGYHIYIYFLNICAQDPKVYVPKNPHPNISPAPVHHTPIVRFSRFTGFLYSQVLLVQKSSCRHSIFRTLNLLTVACLRKSSVSRTLAANSRRMHAANAIGLALRAYLNCPFLPVSPSGALTVALPRCDCSARRRSRTRRDLCLFSAAY